MVEEDEDGECVKVVLSLLCTSDGFSCITSQRFAHHVMAFHLLVKQPANQSSQVLPKVPQMLRDNAARPISSEDVGPLCN